MLMDLKIYFLTWNVVGRAPMEELSPLLDLAEPVDVTALPDLYAIGLQEVSCKPQDLIMDIIFDDPWEVAIKNTLQKWHYIKVKQIRLQGMILLLFARREHVTHLRGIQTDFTRTGLGGMWGNKGGISIRLNVYGCSVCIVNCHLAAHDSEIEQRIEEYNLIIDKQKYIDPLTENIITHDYAFWIGDLNFRIDDFTASEIKDLIRKRNFQLLLSKDQLIQAMVMGRAFSEFTESTPTFPPTYKFQIDSFEYDTEKRKPAWTDRILYRLTPNAYEHVTLDLKQLHYCSHQQYLQSDHKPVTSSFKFKVFSRPEEKSVAFLPIRQWKVNQDSVAWYRFNERFSANTWDWIGLYRANFSGIDEHICYVWAPPRPSSTQPPTGETSEDQIVPEASTSSEQQCLEWYKVIFADQNLLLPGLYRLLYISSEFDDVLGISESFEILSE